jgi:hypothetical protein
MNVYLESAALLRQHAKSCTDAFDKAHHECLATLLEHASTTLLGTPASFRAAMTDASLGGQVKAGEGE